MRFQGPASDFSLPTYLFSGPREFAQNECHINRISQEHVLLIVYSGTLYFLEDGKEIAVGENEYYIQKAGMLQDGHRPSSFVKYYFVHFTYPDLTDHLCGLPLRGKFSGDTVFTAISNLYNAHISPANDHLEKSICFLRLIKKLKNSFTPSTIPLIADTIAYIQANFAQPITLNEIAAQLNYSRDYILKQFKFYCGITPHQYLLRLRIENAKVMLSSSKASLSEIATQCGFNTPSSFYRTFHKDTNQSPSAFRKLHYLSPVSSPHQDLPPPRRIIIRDGE